MKKLTILLMFFSLLSFGQEKAILKVMKNQQIAWNNGDLRGFMQGYWKSEDLVFIGSNGITYGWETTLKNYQKGYPTKAKMGILTFTDMQVKKLGKKHALVIGKWHLERKNNNVGGIYTLTFRKFKNGWKIIADHTE